MNTNIQFPIIFSFFKEYRFLSNFDKTPFYLCGYNWMSVEHYYQSAKCLDLKYQQDIINASSPGIARKLGQGCKLRDDWEKIKEGIMEEGVFAKFSQNKELKDKLIQTDGYYLIEGNDWGDSFWGYDIKKNRGQNRLGFILMEVRSFLKERIN
jgi:hypothetical protein